MKIKSKKKWFCITFKAKKDFKSAARYGRRSYKKGLVYTATRFLTKKDLLEGLERDDIYEVPYEVFYISERG